MAEKGDGYRQTKIEKTGDKTFNVHTEDGGHFECVSPTKLDGMRNVNHLRSETQVFSGMGEKRELVCGRCDKKVLKLKGRFDKVSKSIMYFCDNCS